MKPLRVLIVEDSEDDAVLLLRELRRSGYEPTAARVDTAASMRAALAAQTWDIVICDYTMPRFNAPAALRLLRKSGSDLPFIIASGAIGEDVAVAAMTAGAHDYLMKENLARLGPVIERELRDAEVRQERRRAESAQREEAQISAALARVGRELIAALDTPALLEHLCRITAEVLECDQSHTLLRRPDGEAFVAVARYSDPSDAEEGARVLKLPQEALAVLVARLEHDEVAEADKPPSAPLTSTRLQHFGPGPQLYIALRRGNEIIGLQTAVRRQPAAAFTRAQRRVARGIAQLASMALEHRRLVAELERANRIKSDFLATISHELRTPLNAIIGYNDLLLEGEFGRVTGEQTDILRRIGRSARELFELINATLDLNRLEAGRLPLELQETSLSDLLNEVSAETRELQSKPSVHVGWNVATGLPQPCTDAAKLKVVLKNLIANAVKFTPHGSVTVHARARDGGAEIRIADTGIGIAPDALPIIFEPFRQVESATTRHYGGSGLGLYVVRRLLDVLGGTIAVDSEPGRGSTFTVWIPSIEPAGEDAGTRRAQVSTQLVQHGEGPSRPPLSTQENV
jgi:signal transduction histidine kinase